VVLPPENPEDVAGLPPDVAVAHAFVNTLDLRTFRVHGRQMQRSDAWETPQALGRWLREHQLLAGAGSVTTADLDHARRLRAVLRDSTRQLPPGDAAAGGHDVTALGGFPLLASAGPGTGVRLAPRAGGGVAAALGGVLITAAELTARGLWARMKMCPAADCQWVFFDHSRPGRGRWCSPDLCGNRLKVRAHRQRQGSERGPADLTA
jgi:predicted RNA-binding Zn ribbon-like protein